jgi:hypothetical protein
MEIGHQGRGCWTLSIHLEEKSKCGIQVTAPKSRPVEKQTKRKNMNPEYFFLDLTRADDITPLGGCNEQVHKVVVVNRGAGRRLSPVVGLSNGAMF